MSEEFVPHLRRLERLPNANDWMISTASDAVPGFSTVYGVRPLLFQALKAIQEAPAGFAAYRFSESWKEDAVTLKVPEFISDRSQRLSGLTSRPESGEALLRLSGLPNSFAGGRV